jgi:hypothetical protein
LPPVVDLNDLIAVLRLAPISIVHWNLLELKKKTSAAGRREQLHFYLIGDSLLECFQHRPGNVHLATDLNAMLYGSIVAFLLRPLPFDTLLLGAWKAYLFP